MKTLLYMFRRYRVATVLNLLGLGIAVAAFYLFMTQVIYNRTYNHNIPNHERVFRLDIYGNVYGKNWGACGPRPFETMLKDLPHVEASMDVSPYNYDMTVKVGEREMDATIINISDPGIEFFSGKLLYGSSKDWGRGKVVVSRGMAEKIFGTANGVGKTFTSGDNEVTVVGVSEDLPDNCTIDNGIYVREDDEGLQDWSEWSFNIYVRLDNADNAQKVEREFKLAFMKANNINSEKEFDKEVGMKFRLTPMDDVYFSGTGMKDKGNRGLVDVLMVASIFVIFIAMLNLLNFTLSEMPMRIRGINTRRVMGASACGLRTRLIMENVVLAIVGLAIGVLMIVAFQRSEACMKLVSGDISFKTHHVLLAVMVVATLAVGALSAVVPAWYGTSFAPAMVLKGSFGLSPRGRKLRMAIMGVQFVVAFALTIYIGVMVGQSRYIFSADYGFSKNEVFYATLSKEAMTKKTAIRAELSKLPFVENVGFAQNAIGTSDEYMSWGRGDGDKLVSMTVIPCDYNYLRTMGIKVIAGRDFNESDSTKGAYVANRAFMQTYPWMRVGEPIGRQNEWGDGSNFDIVGECENFKLKSMRNDNSKVAMVFVILPANADMGDRCSRVFVRVAKSQDKIEAKKRIAQVLNRLDGSQEYTMSFLNDDLQRTYIDEFRFIAQVKLFALICILITIIGVFSLTMFETEYRRKEIAIRKVMGSTTGAVIQLFARRYTAPLAAAFVIAAPIGWWLSRQWLQSFAEHTPIHWWLFPLAFVTVSAVVILTVVVQSWRVATSNPVDSIKTE